MIALSIHRFESVGSTNDVALELARGGEPEGTVVVTRSQTAGRGRRGHAWADEPGRSLTMSAILRPELPQDRVHELAFDAGLAVADYLKAGFSLNPALKWPNDVLVRGRKIAGMLVEATKTPYGPAAVVGIGLNVNQTQFPHDIEASATSIALETGGEHSVDSAIEPLATALFDVYESHIAVGFEEILSRWRKYMFGVDEEACVRSEETLVRGTVLGVDSTGALLLRDGAGRFRTIHAGDILTP